jgi:5-methylcytosine-specific restriction endonuclease McrA
MEESTSKILRPSSLGEVQTWKKQQYAHPKWEAKTAEIRRRDNNQCVHCKTRDEKLVVHHRQYHTLGGTWVNLWEYRDEFLITLCDTCHRQGHDAYGNGSFSKKVDILNILNGHI